MQLLLEAARVRTWAGTLLLEPGAAWQVALAYLELYPSRCERLFVPCHLSRVPSPDRIQSVVT